MPNCGGLLIEDFVPYSDERALVSAGKTYRELRHVFDVRYVFRQTLELTDPVELRRGTYLRLGHHHGGELIVSDGWDGPHQPFRHASGFYYSDDAPTARLYRNGELLIDHWGGIAELGNAWVDDFIWFEARDETISAPHGWRICRADLDGGNIAVLFPGANPCMYGGHLYYGIWNDGRFDIARAHRRDCLPTNAYLPAGRADGDRRSEEAA